VTTGDVRNGADTEEAGMQRGRPRLRLQPPLSRFLMILEDANDKQAIWANVAAYLVWSMPHLLSCQDLIRIAQSACLVAEGALQRMCGGRDIESDGHGGEASNSGEIGAVVGWSLLALEGIVHVALGVPPAARYTFDL
jgi:hypothetical protein